MRRVLASAVAGLVFLVSSFAQGGRDWTAIDAKLSEYFAALEAEPVAVKTAECDTLLAACRDRETLNHVAVSLYRLFMESKLMGDEEVAIYLTDNWFAPGRASMPSEVELMNAMVYADFNRQSLIGRKAPELYLYDPDGVRRDALGLRGRVRILYFYDTDCARCNVEKVLLRSLLSEKSHDAALVAVYTGDDAGKWESFREYMAGVPGVSHWWDPDMESDFQRRYGILQTPGLFLLDGAGVIRGRRLDSAALAQLLDVYAPDIEYGSAEYFSLFDDVFATWGEDATVEDVSDMAAYIGAHNLLTGDVSGFKRLAGNLLYYLGGSERMPLRLGAGYVADSLVLSRPDIWCTHSDSVKVVGYASMVHELLSRAPLGSRISPVRVRGKLVRRCGSRDVMRRLDRLPADTYIVFYSPGCSRCAALLGEVRPGRGRNCFLVDMDAMQDRDPDTWQEIMDGFDLSVLPHVIRVGKRGVIAEKYLTDL